MNTNAETPSLILSLQARFEEAWEEYNRVDDAQGRKPPPASDAWLHYYRCERGMASNLIETTAIRQLICWQLPVSDEELTVLAFHVYALFDPGNSMTKSEEEAFEQGLTTIFDYLVSEGRADMGTMGKQFTESAMLAFHRRRHRTGSTDNDD